MSELQRIAGCFMLFFVRALQQADGAECVFKDAKSDEEGDYFQAGSDLSAYSGVFKAAVGVCSWVKVRRLERNK